MPSIPYEVGKQILLNNWRTPRLIYRRLVIVVERAQATIIVKDGVFLA